jgi:hypothetical protein
MFIIPGNRWVVGEGAMPVERSFKAEVDVQRDLVKVVLSGPLGTEEFLAGFAGLLARPDYHPGMRVLVDMLEHVHQLDAKGIGQVAEAFMRNREALRGSVIAVVVARTVSYGLLRMLQIKLSEEPYTFSVLYDLQEAEKSLGL